MSKLFKILIIVFFFQLFFGATPILAATPIIPRLQVPIAPNFSFAEKICAANASGQMVCSIDWIGQYVKMVFNYGLGIAGILAAIMMMVGGLLWLTAGGNQQRVTEAKSYMIASITGIALLLTSYTILYEINPDLVNLKNIQIIGIKEADLKLYKDSRTGGKASEYAAKSCMGLTKGSTYSFYLTGYIKYPHLNNDLDTRCYIALNCWCPDNNKRTGEDCGKIGSHHPCASFDIGKDYCTSTGSGKTPRPGMVAASQDCFKFGDKICIDGKEYTIEDAGSAIQGMRFDIWSDNLKEAHAITGEKTIKIGPCK